MRDVVKQIATGLRNCAPLEYDEPDPAPDFDDDENDDDEYGPIDVLTESIGLPVLNLGRRWYDA